MFSDSILHVARFERDIPGPLTKSSSAVDCRDPFVQRVAFGLVLWTVGSLYFKGKHFTAHQADKKIGHIPTARAGPHIMNLKTEVIILGVGDHIVPLLENIGRVTLVSSEFITSRLSPDTSRFDQPFS